MKRLPIILLSVALLAAGCSGSKTSQTSRQANRTEVTVGSPTPSPKATVQSSTNGEGLSAKCDPNYSPCVPIASDVDCAGGGGNGPVYVRGPIRVIGTDIYGLDRDGDGIACEK
jgi:hypothetical protein